MASNRWVQQQNLANEGQLKIRKLQRINHQKICWLLASPLPHSKHAIFKGSFFVSLQNNKSGSTIYF